MADIRLNLVLVVPRVHVVEDAKTIVEISVPMDVQVAIHLAQVRAVHILHAMEAIALDAAVNAEVKPTVELVREVKIAPIVVLSAL